MRPAVRQWCADSRPGGCGAAVWRQQQPGGRISQGSAAVGMVLQCADVKRRDAAHDSLTHRNTAPLRRCAGLWQRETGRGWKRPCLLLLQTFTVPNVPRAAGPVTAAAAERMILARLRTMDAAAFARLPDCTEGLEYRFLRAVRSACSLEELLGQVKTKRYALSRLRRWRCAPARCGSGRCRSNASVSAPFGLHGGGRAALGQMRRTAQLPVLVKSADVRCLSEDAQRQFLLEARAGELYGLLYPGSFQRKTRRRMAHRAGSGESAVKKEKFLRFKWGFQEL